MIKSLLGVVDFCFGVNYLCMWIWCVQGIVVNVGVKVFLWILMFVKWILLVG